MHRLLSFPNPVNEKAARVVAAAVFATSLIALATSWFWLLVPLTYGFWARALTGPTLSPLGWLAQNVVAPRLGERRPVPGPPKRFAQGIGAALSTVALVCALALDWHVVADVGLVALLAAAGLEAFAGYCLGCRIFGLLIRLGVVPEAVCIECADIRLRPGATSASS